MYDHKEYLRKRRQDPQYREAEHKYAARKRKDPEYRKAARRRYAAWYEQNGRTPERLKRKAEQMKLYRKDPILRAKHIARWIANRAVLSRKIEKLPCAECGAEQAQKHHPDYTQPLLIVWLCQRCHWNLHASAEGK
jgi:hypothetical protein